MFTHPPLPFPLLPFPPLPLHAHSPLPFHFMLTLPFPSITCSPSPSIPLHAHLPLPFHYTLTHPLDTPFIPSFTPMSPAMTPGNVFSVCVSLRGTRNWCTPWCAPSGVQSWAKRMAKLATFPRFPTQHLAASISGEWMMKPC